MVQIKYAMKTEKQSEKLNSLQKITRQISENNKKTKHGHTRKKHKVTIINSTAQNLLRYLEARTCEP